LKAIIQLDDVHLAQAINYLEAFDLEVGLLINFGAKSLEFKRVTNKNFKQKKQGNPKIL
jgi:GxxExxY protein